MLLCGDVEGLSDGAEGGGPSVKGQEEMEREAPSGCDTRKTDD